jgi:plasmid stabilization system protein ParE
MKYQIEISSVAEAEADKAFLWLSGVTGSENASHWYQGLLTTIESLSEMPKRCALAPENDYFSQEIRQLLYGRGRNCYRIYLQFWKVQTFLQFGFCIFDTLHKTLWEKIQEIEIPDKK